jgi:hypothetical protein
MVSTTSSPAWLRLIVALGVFGAAAIGIRAFFAGDRVVTPPVAAPAPRTAGAASPGEAAAGTASPGEDVLRARFAALTYSEAQRAALIEAGFAIKRGAEPTKVLPPGSVETIGRVEEMIHGVECAPPVAAKRCAHYRIDVEQCIDDAGRLIGRRARDRTSVDYNLIIAAYGVSTVIREVPYQSVLNLIDFCQRLFALEKKLRSPVPAEGRRASS